MEKRAYHQHEGGLVKITGATTPTGFPHFCPYQPNGATAKVCEELTSNYQRNLAGCCGTQDNRAFAPCNSKLRKCRKCLSEGRGSKAGAVVDVARGLCKDCVEAVGKPPKAAAPTKSVLYVPPKRPDVSRPVWKPTPKPPAKVVQVVPPALPGADELKMRFVESRKRKTLKAAVVSQPRPQPELDLDACTTLYAKLSLRSKEIIRKVLMYERSQAAGMLNMSTDSLNARFSSLCTELGIPRAHSKAGFDRQTALEKVVARHKEVSVTSHPQPDPEQERQLVEIFRKLPSDERDDVLNYVRGFSKGGEADG